MSFIPFIGGKRICFGKTFAEASLKVVVTYLAQYFKMEFVDKAKYPDASFLPLSQLGQSHFPPILVQLRGQN